MASIRAWIIGLAILAAAGTPAVNAHDAAKVRTISVFGQGRVTVAPDMALVTAGVETRLEDPKAALAANSRAVAAVMEVLRQHGIPERAVQTSGFHVYPDYRRDPEDEGEMRLDSYRVSNQLRVQVEDMGRLGELLAALVEAGGNRLSGIEFGVSNASELADEARRRALADARRRAELYAGAAGVALGEVLSIAETDTGEPGPVLQRSMIRMEAAAVPVAPGENEVTAGVRVEFGVQ